LGLLFEAGDNVAAEAEVRSWLVRHGPTQPVNESSDTARRNNLIRHSIQEGKSRQAVCELLDRQAIPTTEDMRRAGVVLWVVAWQDPDFKANVQTIISKVCRGLSRPR